MSPTLRQDRATGLWVTVEPIHFAGITVPAGYPTDLASIPRPIWLIPGFGPHELSVVAPAVHDYLYDVRLPGITRRDADRIFRQAMEDQGVGAIRRTIAWLGVRAGGWVSWRPPESVMREIAFRSGWTGAQVGVAMAVADGWVIPVVAMALAALKNGVTASIEKWSYPDEE